MSKLLSMYLVFLWHRPFLHYQPFQVQLCCDDLLCSSCLIYRHTSFRNKYICVYLCNCSCKIHPKKFENEHFQSMTSEILPTMPPTTLPCFVTSASEQFYLVVKIGMTRRPTTLLKYLDNNFQNQHQFEVKGYFTGGGVPP